ncbi:MAG: FAD-dependent oxidoreductase [Thermoleophilia bacterium]|nr:FAD-dependent oxidoreductase [Thermoleophilia bacterium]
MEQNKNISTLKLISSHDEVGNVRTFIFETGGLTWVAGQSLGYTLPQAGEAEAEKQRWFTIASAPSERAIHISTRVSESRFKQALNAMKPGEEIKAYDLGGDFTWKEESDEPVVMVAAGIGVTPFRSILLERHKAEKPLNATLLYFNRTEEVPFQTELQKLSNKHPEFTLRIVIGEHVTADKIIELAPQARKQIFYLSGPKPMVESIGLKLRERGITVKQDRFPGYDEKNY